MEERLTDGEMSSQAVREIVREKKSKFVPRNGTRHVDHLSLLASLLFFQLSVVLILSKPLTHRVRALALCFFPGCFPTFFCYFSTGNGFDRGSAECSRHPAAGQDAGRGREGARSGGRGGPQAARTGAFFQPNACAFLPLVLLALVVSMRSILRLLSIVEGLVFPVGIFTP